MPKNRDKVKVLRTIWSCCSLAQLNMAHALMYRYRDYYKEEIDDLRSAYFRISRKLGGMPRAEG